jgi:hypothetical protein
VNAAEPKYFLHPRIDAWRASRYGRRMKSGGLTGALVVALLTPIVLVASGGDPRTIWGELRRMVGGNLVAYAASVSMPVPFGGDDTGTVITFDKQILTCEDAVVKNYAHLVSCILGCHVKTAKAIAAGKTADDEACESGDPVKSCRAKYDAASAKIVGRGCPNCLDLAHQATMADDVESSLDANNQDFFCAQ